MTENNDSTQGVEEALKNKQTQGEVDAEIQKLKDALGKSQGQPKTDLNQAKQDQEEQNPQNQR